MQSASRLFVLVIISSGVATAPAAAGGRKGGKGPRGAISAASAQTSGALVCAPRSGVEQEYSQSKKAALSLLTYLLTKNKSNFFDLMTSPFTRWFCLHNKVECDSLLMI